MRIMYIRCDGCRRMIPVPIDKIIAAVENPNDDGHVDLMSVAATCAECRDLKVSAPEKFNDQARIAIRDIFETIH